MPRKAASPKSVELDRSRTPLIVAAMLMIGIGVSAGAIMWGRSDSGQIDVSATIANSQVSGQGTQSGSGSSVSAPAQEYVDMPNGGLVPAGGGDNPAPTPAPVTEEAESASSTNETADGEAAPSAETEPASDSESASGDTESGGTTDTSDASTGAE